MKLYGIFGAGGFGREVMPVADAMLNSQFSKTEYQLVFIEEQTPKVSQLNRYAVMSANEFLQHEAKEKYFNIAIASFDVRKRLSEFMMKQSVKPFSIIAANSTILDDNEIGEGAILCPFTTITSNAKIGKFFHANIYSYVAHDCVIGNYVTFAPNVCCNGNVVIEDDAYIGTGAIIKQGTPAKPMVIGRGAIIGMGAVVTKSVAPGITVVGNPAQPFERKEIKETITI